jgi:hypothetical protein
MIGSAERNIGARQTPNRLPVSIGCLNLPATVYRRTWRQLLPLRETRYNRQGLTLHPASHIDILRRMHRVTVHAPGGRDLRN